MEKIKNIESWVVPNIGWRMILGGDDKTDYDQLLKSISRYNEDKK